MSEIEKEEAVEEKNAVESGEAVQEEPQKDGILKSVADEGKGIVKDELNRAKKKAIRSAKNSLRRTIRDGIRFILK
ncbi:MAG: hypothetical protein PQJ58_08290 [Spirochaetales bacterium]|nr:hypothetical protein [Spirochaetales bacterium]